MADQKLTPDMWAYLLGAYCRRLGPQNLENTRKALVRRGLLLGTSTRWGPEPTSVGHDLIRKVLEITP